MKKINVASLIVLAGVLIGTKVYVDNNVNKMFETEFGRKTMHFLSNFYHNSDILFKIGYQYEKGENVKQDVNKSKLYYIKAVENGSKEAFFRLANILYYEDKFNDSMQYYTMYINSSDPIKENLVEAYMHRAYTYYLKMDAKKEAFYDFKKVLDLELNNSNAALNVALMYFKGEGVEVNETEALKYFKIAGYAKDKKAQFYVGIFYLKGLGGAPVDVKEAEKWFELSADNNSDKEYSCQLAEFYGKNIFNYKQDDKNLEEKIKFYFNKCFNLH